MKIGDKILFYLFNEKLPGIVININDEGNPTIEVNGVKYPNVRTFSKLPKNKSEIPPWYILGTGI